jgi:S1-C subfamily serine protease
MNKFKLLVIAFIISAFQLVTAQVIEVKPAETTINQIARTGVSVKIELDKKTVEKQWLKLIKQWGKTESFKQGGYQVQQAMVPSISASAVVVYTGIEADEVDESSEKLNKVTEGALIKNVYNESPGTKAGLQVGDVIVKIQDRAISGKSSFDEHMSYYRPGDKIKINYIRKGEAKETSMTLTNQDGGTTLEKKRSIGSEKLGADFANVTKVELQKYNITSGVKVSNIRGGLIANMGIEDGFIFLKYNGGVCKEASELISQLEVADGKIQIEGLGADGGRRIYNFWY